MAAVEVEVPPAVAVVEVVGMVAAGGRRSNKYIVLVPSVSLTEMDGEESVDRECWFCCGERETRDSTASFARLSIILSCLEPVCRRVTQMKPCVRAFRQLNCRLRAQQNVHPSCVLGSHVRGCAGAVQLPHSTHLLVSPRPA